MTDRQLDALLERVAELLKLCERSDATGNGLLSTVTIRNLFAPRLVHPAVRFAASSRKGPSHL